MKHGETNMKIFFTSTLAALCLVLLSLPSLAEEPPAGELSSAQRVLPEANGSATATDLLEELKAEDSELSTSENQESDGFLSAVKAWEVFLTANIEELDESDVNETLDSLSDALDASGLEPDGILRAMRQAVTIAAPDEKNAELTAFMGMLIPMIMEASESYASELEDKAFQYCSKNFPKSTSYSIDEYDVRASGNDVLHITCH